MTKTTLWQAHGIFRKKLQPSLGFQFVGLMGSICTCRHHREILQFFEHIFVWHRLCPWTCSTKTELEQERKQGQGDLRSYPRDRHYTKKNQYQNDNGWMLTDDQHTFVVSSCSLGSVSLRARKPCLISSSGSPLEMKWDEMATNDIRMG